jgi:ATP-dependent helicase HrpB
LVYTNKNFMFCPVVKPLIPNICAALDEKGAAVLRADPGTGKSTLVPLGLLRHFENTGQQGKIVMLEPRRAAALGIAARLAELLGEETGERAGYAVRLERRVSAKTRIEVVTEGLLTRRMRENPEMPGVSTLVFDEFHERSIYTDLAFALALDLRRMGSPVRILVMSATLDAAQVAAHIDAVENRGAARGTAVFDLSGGLFPVETVYRPLHGKEELARQWAAALCGVIEDEAASESPGDSPRRDDALVFLPGRREIALCAETLKSRGIDRVFDILTLHGSLSLREQRAVIAPPEQRARRRIILATNVAETSLTIPGVGLVVDSGYARAQRFHLPSGMNRLSLEPISAASADQRRGRAGRLGPGRCVRLWAENEARPAETDPEIRRVDLSGLALDCLLWGVRHRLELPWLEAPVEVAWDKALELLIGLGAVSTGSGRPEPTALGREIGGLGLEPRLGALCVAGRIYGLAALACAAAALLSGRDGADDDPDFSLRLAALRNGKGRAPQAREIACDLLRRLGENVSLSWSAEDEANAGELLARAFPDRLARKRDVPGNNGRAEAIFRFPSGREGRLRLPLAAAEWICALEVDAGERMGFIRLAVPVTEQNALEALKPQTLTETAVEWAGLVPRCQARSCAGKIELSRRQRPCTRAELIPELTPLFRREGLGLLPWEENRGAARRLLERIRFFEVHAPAVGSTPAYWTDEALIEDAADWLGPFIWQGAESGKGPIIDGSGLVSALENRLGWQRTGELDRLVPDQFTVSGGTRQAAGKPARKKPIDYSSGEPFVRIRLQDAFGIPKVCKILSVPVIFELLSPADRPIQITRDLGGFWAGSYAEVRKEMRGRYPKHDWPENPLDFNKE